MIYIPTKIVDAIRRQAVSESPDEACGYLAGEDDQVISRIPMTNVDHSPEHFTFDPVEQFDAIKRAREEGYSLIAVYHSHPATPARMSEEDKRLAYDTEIVYIIMSLKDDLTKAFKINAQKEVSELPIQFVE
jgi:[CysO sulfur-carrier protein]-S-L-cysteine hydrolase